MSTWLDPAKLEAECCTVEEEDPEYFYCTDPCQNYLTVPFERSFIRDFVVVFCSVGLGATAGVIAGNVAGKKAAKHSRDESGSGSCHVKKGPRGRPGQRGPAGPPGRPGLMGQSRLMESPVSKGPAALQFAFTSIPPMNGVMGQWKGLVVQPDGTVSLVGTFDLSLSSQTHIIQFPNSQIGTYTIVFLASAPISSRGSTLGFCTVSNNLNAATSTFSLVNPLTVAGSEVTFEYVYSTDTIP